MVIFEHGHVEQMQGLLEVMPIVVADDEEDVDID